LTGMPMLRQVSQHWGPIPENETFFS
jgi:hypothetical protein